MKTSDQILKTCCNSSCEMGPLIEQVKEMENLIGDKFQCEPNADGTSELSYEAKLMNLANTARDNGQVRLAARLCDISKGVGAIEKAQRNAD